MKKNTKQEYQEYQDYQCKYKYKTIYSLRIRIQLQLMDFEPVAELINPYKPQFKCWRYIDSPEFEEALGKIMTGGRKNG